MLPEIPPALPDRGIQAGARAAILTNFLFPLEEGFIQDAV
jgi:hypothetical protein